MHPASRQRVGRELVVRNGLGFHCRLITAFVDCAKRYRCRIVVRHGPGLADGRSVLDLMTLAAADGARLSIEADGDDAGPAVDALARLIDGWQTEGHR